MLMGQWMPSLGTEVLSKDPHEELKAFKRAGCACEAVSIRRGYCLLQAHSGLLFLSNFAHFLTFQLIILALASFHVIPMNDPLLKRAKGSCRWSEGAVSVPQFGEPVLWTLGSSLP